MDMEFHKNPFTRDRLKVHAIHRSLSRHHFFIKFIENKFVSDGFLLTTMINDYGLVMGVTTSSTVWDPPFGAMKILLIIETKINEDISYDKRKELLKQEVDSFVFGTITFQEQTFDIIVNNKDEEIILQKIKTS